MVPGRLAVKHPRHWIPLLGILALAMLFLKLPETPHVFTFFECKSCTSGDPYIPLVGAGYFALLTAIALLFPAFPSPRMALGGLIWAVLLAVVLTYLSLPNWCPACLFAHLCHLAMWTIWVVWPAETEASETPKRPMRERLYLALCAPVGVIALFSSLNLTFMAYGFRLKTQTTTSLQTGDVAPTTLGKKGDHEKKGDEEAQATGLFINFVSAECPYCREELKLLERVVPHIDRSTYRFVNVTPLLSPELMERLPTVEWLEDRGGKLRELFNVSGYPTLFVIASDGTISQVFSGVSDEMKSYLNALVPASAPAATSVPVSADIEGKLPRAAVDSVAGEL